jgi:hypothetical protein
MNSKLKDNRMVELLGDVTVDELVEDGLTVLKDVTVGPVVVELVVVAIPKQSHALEILEGIAEHTEA